MKNINKNRILNLRVSKKTYEKITDKARKNGETISNFIRSVIQDSIEVASDISSDLMGKEPRDRIQEVVSYHEAKLARSVPCDNCGISIKKHSAITVGETSTGSVFFFCEKCRPK